MITISIIKTQQLSLIKMCISYLYFVKISKLKSWYQGWCMTITRNQGYKGSQGITAATGLYNIVLININGRVRIYHRIYVIYIMMYTSALWPSRLKVDITFWPCNLYIRGECKREEKLWFILWLNRHLPVLNIMIL